MKKCNMGRLGFTLIELLVVVLIIGILVAVALPQYEKAVVKSRAIQAMALVKSIGQAAETYYLANGTLPTQFDQLDVSIPAGWTGNEKFYNTGIVDVRSNGEWSLVMEKQGNTLWAIHAGKLTGYYAGIGFSYYLLWPPNVTPVPEHQLLCSETKTYSSYIFSKSPGDFCIKMLNGVLKWDEGLRLYTLP